MKDYNPKKCWNERFRKYGRVGDVDNLLYSYVQAYRLKAVEKTLSCAKVQINKDIRILDVGCGTGDLISSFIKKRKSDITGIDFSEEVIAYTKRRLSSNENVELFTMEAEDMNLAPASFDLVTGINILQHITDEGKFYRAVKNMIEVTKLKRHIFVMDFSPIKIKNREPTSYLVIRPREEYIQAFENNGCKLIYELGLFRIGVRLHHFTIEAIANLSKFLRRHKRKIAEKGMAENKSTKSTFSWLYNLVRYIVLKLTKPLDYFLLSHSFKYADMRILVFKKVSVCSVKKNG